MSLAVWMTGLIYTALIVLLALLVIALVVGYELLRRDFRRLAQSVNVTENLERTLRIEEQVRQLRGELAAGRGQSDRLSQPGDALLARQLDELRDRLSQLQATLDAANGRQPRGLRGQTGLPDQPTRAGNGQGSGAVIPEMGAPGGNGSKGRPSRAEDGQGSADGEATQERPSRLQSRLIRRTAGEAEPGAAADEPTIFSLLSADPAKPDALPPGPAGDGQAGASPAGDPPATPASAKAKPSAVLQQVVQSRRQKKRRRRK